MKVSFIPRSFFSKFMLRSTIFGVLLFGGFAWVLNLAVAEKTNKALRALAQDSKKTLSVGSKNFTESYLLAEMISQVLEAEGFEVKRKFGLGGTAITFRALEEGQIDIYPEYTGTLKEVLERMEGGRPDWLKVHTTLGFNNTYALAVRAPTAERLDLSTMSDLQEHGDLSWSFNHEFLERPDGWRGLKEIYNFQVEPLILEHGVAYETLAQKETDVIIVYSTDGKIEKYDLKVLKDDKSYFPEYLAVPISRKDFPTEATKAVAKLNGLLDEKIMRELNAKVDVGGGGFGEVARDFLSQAEMGGEGALVSGDVKSFWDLLWERILQHLFLMFASLLPAILVACPAGYLIYKKRGLSSAVTSVAGVLQTIPSLALVVLMIPIVGIGVPAALLALFVYSLLPILRNTYIAFVDLPREVIDAAEGIGLPPGRKFFLVELPLALPVILAGIKTAGVIAIGTATLAAFVGAGGLGDPIVTGLALNDMGLILEGAIPAALLAIIFELTVEYLEKKLHILLT
jgi:osmoprotectant transport system permease protein